MPAFKKDRDGSVRGRTGAARGACDENSFLGHGFSFY
jgi:hypothetical protein